MVAWNAFVGFLAVVLSMLTTAYSGNLGFAIITLSLITRLALLPLTGMRKRSKGFCRRSSARSMS